MSKIFKGLFSLGFILLFSLTSQAKLHPKIDSMRNALEGTQGIERLNILWFLGRTMIHHENEQANKFLDEGLLVMESIDTLSAANRQLTKAKFQSVRQWGCFELNDYYCAFKGSLKLDSIAKVLVELGEENWALRYFGDNHTLRGAIFSQQKRFKNAGKEFKQTLAKAYELNDTTKICWGLQNVGYNNLLSDSFDLAIPYFLRADTLFRIVNTRPFNIVQNNFGLGKCYIEMGNWQAAEEVFKESIALCEEKGLPRINLAQVQYARALLGLGKIEEAYKYAMKGLETMENEDKLQDLTLAYKYLALIEEARANSSSALVFQKKATALENENEDKQFSQELLALQSEYENFNNRPATVSSNWWWWWLLPLGIFLGGAIIWFIRRKPEETKPLEIAWKNELETTEISDPFLERFINKVQDSLQDETLSVEGIADEFKVSRVQLFKKIKAATGTSPSQLIRKIRLETAERLLIENSTTVSEVAYKVGFSNPNSFSRSFKDHFGKSPRDYLGKVGT